MELRGYLGAEAGQLFRLSLQEQDLTDVKVGVSFSSISNIVGHTEPDSTEREPQLYRQGAMFLLSLEANYCLKDCSFVFYIKYILS